MHIILLHYCLNYNKEYNIFVKIVWKNWEKIKKKLRKNWEKIVEINFRKIYNIEKNEKDDKDGR